MVRHGRAESERRVAARVTESRRTAAIRPRSTTSAHSFGLTLSSTHWTSKTPTRGSPVWGELAEHTGGRLDVLITNAGILSAGRFADIPVASQRSIININVGGTLNGCHAAYPYLRSTPKSQVINIASASAIYGQAELATYSASKFAIRGLTEALELEWADDGVRVCAVWPLFVNTGMVDGVDTSSTRALGVSLTADDVAESIFEIAESRPRLPHGPHFAVGRQAKALMAMAGVVPSWVLREINRRATGH